MEQCNPNNKIEKRFNNHETRESLLAITCIDCGFEFEGSVEWDSGCQLDEEKIIIDEFKQKHKEHKKTEEKPKIINLKITNANNKAIRAEALKEEVEKIENKSETKQIVQKRDKNGHIFYRILSDSSIEPADIYKEGEDNFITRQSFAMPATKVRGNARGFTKGRGKIKIIKTMKTSSAVVWLGVKVSIENPIIQRVFYFETSHRRDKDNFDISTKPIIDGMTAAKVFDDDNKVVFLPTLFRKGKPRVEILLFKAVPPVMLFC